MTRILLSTIFITFFIGATSVNAETKNYKVVSYAWGSTPKSAPSSKNIAWGKMKNVDYEITIDDNEKNPNIIIKEKKNTYKYKILGQVWGQKEFNHTSDGWTINRCYVEDEFGHTNAFTIRENIDGRIFFYLFKNGIVYAYGTLKDNELKSDMIVNDTNK